MVTPGSGWVEAWGAAGWHRAQDYPPLQHFPARTAGVLWERNPALSVAVCSELCILTDFSVFGCFRRVPCCFSALEENLLVPFPQPPHPQHQPFFSGSVVSDFGRSLSPSGLHFFINSTSISSCRPGLLQREAGDRRGESCHSMQTPS